MRWMTLCAILAIFALSFMTPESAYAWPGKEQSCTSCHSGTDPDAVIYTAIDGIAGTSVTVAAGGSFEVDFYFENATEAPTYGIGLQIVIPDLWTVTPGTSNSPTIGGPGWNGAWDAVAGVGWSVLYDSNNQFAGTDAATMNFGGSAWDTGTGGRGGRNAGCDEGPSCSAGGTDGDGFAERMGSDATVNVDAGASGVYTVYVMAVGHDPGPGKTNVPQAITVTIGSPATPPSNVSGPTPSATDWAGTHVDSPFHLNAVFDDNGDAIISCDYDIGGGWVSGALSGSGAATNCDADPTCSDGTAMTILMQATNGGGSTSTSSIGRTCDTAAPTTTYSWPGAWQSTDENSILGTNDGTGSGVASTEWCIDTLDTCTPNTDGDSFGTGTSVNVTCGAGSVCTQYARYRSIDNLSNTETTVSSGAVQIDKSAPGTIGDFATGVPTSSSIPLTWSNPADSGSGNTSYEVRYRIGTTFIEGDWAAATAPGGEPVPPTTGMSVGSLSASTDYAFAIKTTDAVGNVSIISNAAVATTDPGADVSPPTTSNNRITSLNESGLFVGDPLDLAGDLTDNESDVTTCEYCVQNGSECDDLSIWAAGSVSGSTPTWTCSASGVAAYTAGGGFTEGDSIYIDVRGTSTGGQNDIGGTSLMRTMDKVATVIADLAAPTQSSVSVDLTWSDPVDGGSGNASYDVRYVTGATFLEGQWAGANDPGGEPTPSTTGMTVGSLSASTQYTFAIKTTDNLGNQSAISNTVTVTTDPPPDGTPPGTSNIIITANESGTFAGDPFNMSGDLTDAESTVSSCQYCIKNGSECTNADTWAAGAVSGSGPTWTCSVTGLAAYTAGGGFTDADSVYVDVRGTSSGGQNIDGGTSLVRTMDKAATVIADLAAPTQTSVSVDLTWSDPVDGGSGNASYDVRYVAGATFLEAQWAAATDPAGESAPPATGLTVGSLSASTQYTFAIKTTDNLGNQAAISNTVTVTTDDGTVPVTSNIIITANESGTYVGDPFNMSGDLTDAESAVAGCEYCVKNGSECAAADTWTAGSISGVGPTWTCSATGVASYTAGGGFTDADSVYIDVRGTSSAGTNNDGGTALIRTIDKGAPGVIADLGTSGQADTTVDLTWSDPVDGGSGNATYDIRYVAGATFIEAQWASANDPGGEPTPSITGMTVGSLSPLTQYTFAIKTTDNLGNQAAISNTVTATTTGDSNPPVIGTVTPQNFDDGSYLDNTFDLTATANEANTVTGCEYCVSTDGTCDTEWAAGTVGGSAPNWTCIQTGITGYADTTVLTFNIRADDNATNQGTGTPVSRTVDSSSPAAIADLAAPTNTHDTVDLTWANPSDGTGSGNAGFDVRYVTGASFIEGQWAAATDPGGEPVPPSTGVSVSSLSPTTQYTFAIKTTDNVTNQSVISNTVTVTTDGAPDLVDPTTAVTTPADSSYINSGDADPYSIQGPADDNVAVQGIEISIDGGVWTPASCTGCPGASVTWSYSWTLSVDGSYTIQSRATDTSSNQALSTVVNVTVDRTGPSVGSAATNILDSGELSDNISWQEQTSSPSLTLPENAQEIVITINSRTGSDPSATTDLWIDDVSIVYVPDPPPVSSVTDPTDLSYLNSGAADPYSVNGSATDNTAVEKIEVSINGGTWTEVICTGCPGTSVTWAYNWTLPVDGSYTIQSRATDSSTNVETSAAGITVTVDRADPASSVTDPAEASTLNNSSPDPYTVNGSATDNDGVASIEFYDGSTWQPTVCTGCPGTSVTWTYIWTLPGDGGYTINSRSTDSAGNVETEGAGNSITISRTGPTVLSTNPSNGASGVTPDSNVTITFDVNNINCATVDAATIASDSPGWTFSTCQIDQPLAGQTLAAYTTSGQNSATTYNVNVTTGVQDNTGNPATAYAFSFTTTDVDPPSSAITDPADSAVIDSNAPDPLNITGTATDNVIVSSIDVSINGGAWNPAVCTGCPGENVVWSYDWTLPADGSYTIQSRATDNSSNQETPAAGNIVTVDASVPSSTITAPADATYLGSGDFPYNVNGSASDTSNNITGVEVSTDGGNSWSAAICTGCPGTNVTWSYSWTLPSTESNYIIRVRATDVANNVEVPSPGNTTTYDGTAPAVSATSPANSATDVATDRDVIITFTEDNLDCGTVNTTNVTSDSPGWTLSNCDDVTGIVTFTTSGQSNYTTYNVNVTTVIADKSGNALGSAYPFSYTVGTANTIPGNPSTLRQYKTDDATQITQGTTTDETAIVIWADVTDTDADKVLIQAEIVLNASSFTGTPNCTMGNPVVIPGTAKVSCGDLTDGSDYKWRVRAHDGKEYSSWIAYGGNPDVTIVTPLNTSVLMHNSDNLGTKYWSAQGGWGVAGGQYGEFVCETCHTDTTINIKRIKQTITAPNSPTNDFPGSSVVFDDPREGTSNFGDDLGGHSTSNKICETCHTQTSYHRYNTSGQTKLDHNNQRNCTQCHYHKNSFKGLGGDCTGCHNGIPGTTYVSRDVVGSDFTQASRHVFGGTVTNWDCIICHMEGDENQAASGAIATTAYHPYADGKVDLRDVDNPGTRVVEWDKNNVTDAMHTGMDTFCMKCHDSDSSRGAGQGGASGIAVATGDANVTLSPTLDERMKPFNSTDEIDTGAGGGTMTIAGYERQAVLDAYGQFDPTNESHHAVRGQAYSSHNSNWASPAWSNPTLKNGTTLRTNYEASTLHCADCHTTDLNGHGGTNGFMLTANSIDNTCWNCHSQSEYSNNSSNDVRWRHDNDSNTFDSGRSSKIGAYNGNHGSFCRTCHGGNIGEGGSFIDGYGGMHGMDTGLTGADSRSGQPRYRFQGGIYMSHNPGSWTGTGGTATCYFSATKTIDWSNCGQHNSPQTGRTDPPQYSRGTPGQY